MDKVYSSTDDQIHILCSRGMTIADAACAKRTIDLENYYNLINGYKQPFLDSTYSGSDERYISGTKFEEIHSLYLFDRELRNLFIRYILELENNVKSVLAHDFSAKYGHENYLKIAHFDISVKRWEKMTASQKIGAISALISGLQHEIARQLSKNNPMISHYMLEYGYVPLWVLVNALSLGTIGIFYSYLKQKDQNDIGRQFLTIYRNACAHDERLYNLKSLRNNMKPNSIRTLSLHGKLGIPVNSSNNPIYGKNDLFAIIIIFKTMLPKKSFDTFFMALKKLTDELAVRLCTIPFQSIEREMGFPPNWADISKV
nr:Abi family protein [uncultured Acetatifactor sp.]